MQQFYKTAKTVDLSMRQTMSVRMSIMTT